MITVLRPISWLTDVAFALAAVILFEALLLPIPLFVPYACETCAANIPQLPLVPFLAALLAYLLAPSCISTLRNRVRKALFLGIVATAYLGLVHAAVTPLLDPYFTLPYRAYALLAVAAWTGGLVVGVRASLRSNVPEQRTLARPVALLIAGAWIWVVLAAPVALAIAILAGALAGGIVQTLGFPQVALRHLRPVHLASAAIVLAVSFRLVFGLQTLARTGPGLAFAYASDDGNSFYQKAVDLVADPATILAVLTAKDGYAPLYPVFLAALFAPTGGSLAAVIVVQALLAGATVALLYGLAKRIVGTAAALIAAFLYAADQNLIQINSTLTVEALLLPMLIGAFLALAIYSEAGQVRWLGVAAVGLALVFVTRNVIGIAIVAAIFWLVWLHGRVSLRMLRDPAILIAAMLIAAAPIGIATAAAEGKPRLTNQLASFSFSYQQGDGNTVENEYLVLRGIDPFRDPVGSTIAIAQDPLGIVGFYIVAAPQRLSYLLFSVTPGSSDPIAITNPGAYPNRFGQLWEVVLVGALFVGALGMWRARIWQRHPEALLLLIYFLLYLFLFTFIFPPRQAFRYRVPIEPVLMIVQASGLLLLARALAPRDHGPAPLSSTPPIPKSL